jgi:hypothetical protein
MAIIRTAFADIIYTSAVQNPVSSAMNLGSNPGRAIIGYLALNNSRSVSSVSVTSGDSLSSSATPEIVDGFKRTAFAGTVTQSGSQTVTFTTDSPAPSENKWGQVVSYEGVASIRSIALVSGIASTNPTATVTTVPGDMVVLLGISGGAAATLSAAGGATDFDGGLADCIALEKTATTTSTTINGTWSGASAWYATVVVLAPLGGGSPTLTNSTGTATGPTQATIGVTSDTAGTIYSLILPAATAAPVDAATLIANGSAVSRTISTTGTPQTFAITGLTTNTAVKVHWAMTGSNVVSSASFTPNTLAISGTALSAQTGSSGSALTWTGATPNSLLTNSGNGSGTWTVTAGVGSSGITGCNPTTGVPIAATLGTAGSYTITLTYTDSSTVPAAQTVTKTFGLTISTPDAVAPTLTGSITVSSLLNTSYTLTWPSATDNVAVTGYEYSLNAGSTYTSVGNALTVNITGRSAGTTDQVRVRAFDGAGNRSSALAASVTLPSSIVKTPPLENTDGTLHLAATVNWSWYPGGRIGSFGSITPQEGTGTTNAVDGTLTIGTLTPGTGVLMTCVRAGSASTDSVHYHFITVT